MHIYKSIIRGILDTCRFVANVMFGSIVGYLVVLNIQNLITANILQLWTGIIVLIALPFNIVIALVYDHFVRND